MLDVRIGQAGLLDRVDEAVSRFCLGRKEGLSDLGVEQDLLDEGFTEDEIRAALSQIDRVCPRFPAPTVIEPTVVTLPTSTTSPTVAPSRSKLVPVAVGVGVFIATAGLLWALTRRG